MAEICCGVVSESDAGAVAVYKPSTRDARRRRMEIRRFKFVGDAAPPSPVATEETSCERKRRRLENCLSRDCDNASEYCTLTDEEEKLPTDTESNLKLSKTVLDYKPTPLPEPPIRTHPKYGVASVCGRRRDMEDAVAVHPFFHHDSSKELHYFGVYDGHGCSHVAMRCRERMHELVKEELELVGDWKEAMERSFSRMDREAIASNERSTGSTRNSCRCELQSPECDAVGSTAVVAIVTPDKIIVANCGDSRAVLARKGQAVALSLDHKPDRPDELNRIQEAGGRVIYWDGPRVLGVLAMSRAIGDNYLKPYVSSKPEVMVVDRRPGDDCLILATDGLWDVVSNETACGVASMCLKGKVPAPPLEVPGVSPEMSPEMEMSDKACSDASMLLTKLALARRSADNVSVVVVDLRKSNTEA